MRDRRGQNTFVDVGGIGFLPRLVALLLVTSWCGRLLSSFFLFSRSLTSWGLAASGGLLLSSFGRHFVWR